MNGKSESIKRVRRHTRDGERIFAQAGSDKDLSKNKIMIK